MADIASKRLISRKKSGGNNRCFRFLSPTGNVRVILIAAGENNRRTRKEEAFIENKKCEENRIQGFHSLLSITMNPAALERGAPAADPGPS
jgi:hypothetical protein